MPHDTLTIANSNNKNTLRTMFNIDDYLDEHPYDAALDNLDQRIAQLEQQAEAHISNTEALQTMFNCIDLTTLNATDSSESVREFVQHVNNFATQFPNLKNVGGICVYSVFAPVLKSTLAVDGVHRAVVAACFPSSQTFTDVKVAEVRKSVDAGATEVDVVISVGEFLSHNYQFVFEELQQLREASRGARLKVILETGALPTHQQVWEASLIAMKAGADFIKTSTGKNCGGATPEAAIVMCEAISMVAQKEGKRVGFKPAGGVQTPQQAALYYEIVRSILGPEWLDNIHFRIGASRLANALLAQIVTLGGGADPGKVF